MLRQSILFILLCLLGTPIFAQDTLILVTGEKLAFRKIQYAKTEIGIVTYKEKENKIYPWSEVYGVSLIQHNNDFFVKPATDEKSDFEYQILERLAAGAISLYAIHNTKGQIDKSMNSFSYFMEKEGKLKPVFVSIASGKRKKKLNANFKSFLYDDPDCIFYVDGPTFKYGPKGIQETVRRYNLTNYEEVPVTGNDLMGKVTLYRTKLQKTKSGIRIRLYGKKHQLYIEDFITLDLPVNRGSKLILSDGKYRSEVVLSGTFNQQYFEVVLDPISERFNFEAKQGSELQYEFFRVKNVTTDKMKKDH